MGSQRNNTADATKHVPALAEAFDEHCGNVYEPVNRVVINESLMPKTSRERLACSRRVIAHLMRAYKVAAVRVEFETNNGQHVMIVTLKDDWRPAEPETITLQAGRRSR